MRTYLHMSKKYGKIISGALWLGVGALITKILGAVYRVPLTNILGGNGLGLYQMVFPVYTVLLDFSGAGVPNALAKLISSVEENKRIETARKYLFSGLKLLFWLGLIFSGLMFIFAHPLAKLQGNEQATLGYVFLAPAILFVALLSCVRGYFQGLMNMRPTAISQVIEQGVKLSLGLILTYLLMPNLPLAVAGATFAITISEVVALIYLFIKYKSFSKKIPVDFTIDKKSNASLIKKIIKVTIPITLVGIMIPLSQVIDSFIILNVIGGYRTDATSLYGLLSGVVATVVGVPVAVCYGLSAVAVPSVSSAKDNKEKNKLATKSIVLTLFVALPCAIVCYFFAPLIIRLLFSRLSQVEKITAINLLKISAPTIVLLSLLQTTNAVLIGKGKLYMPVISLGVGVFIKEITCFVLVSNELINIYGGAISVIACYFVVCLINLIMIFKPKVKYASKRTYGRQYAS